MSLVHRIKFLCDEKKMTFAELERRVGLSNGQIRRWDNSSPKIENVQKIADFFQVSTDYLLGRTDNLQVEISDDSNADEDYFKIERFARNLTPKGRRKALKVLEATFDDAFDEEDDEDDDL